MSLGLDSEILALPLRHQGPGSPGQEEDPSFHSPFLCWVLRPLGANRNTRDQKGAVGGGLSPPSCPCPWCLMLREAPARCILPAVPHPHARSEWGSPGPAFLLGGAEGDRDRCGSLRTSSLRPPLQAPPPALSRALGPPCPSSQPWGRDPPTLQRGQGIPLPLVPSPLIPQSSLAQGEVGWALLS